MNRRTFVRNATVASVTLASVRSFSETKSHAAVEATPAPAFELDELTVDELQRGMTSGKYTVQSLTRKYLDRIDDIDKRGPAINSVIEMNPEALTIASELDKDRKAGRTRGRLHGIPVLIKDNIDTHDRMTTTAGSLALADRFPCRIRSSPGDCARRAR